MKLQLSAHMRNPRFNKDGSATLSFTTAQEIPDDEVIYLLNAGRRDELGWLMWSPNVFQEGDIPKEQAPETGKTPSERLRGILYIEWEQKGKQGTFNAYYVERMDKICEALKGRLDKTI